MLGSLVCSANRTGRRRMLAWHSREYVLYSCWNRKVERAGLGMCTGGIAPSAQNKLLRTGRCWSRWTSFECTNHIPGNMVTGKPMYWIEPLFELFPINWEKSPSAEAGGWDGSGGIAECGWSYIRVCCGSVHAVGIDGKGCCEWLAVWSAQGVWLGLPCMVNKSDRSVRLPRLIGTACPPYHIVVRKKEKGMVGRKERLSVVD